MKKQIIFLFSITVMAVAPLMGQDGPMTPPPALDNEFLSFLEGEWGGSSESPMGTTSDHFSFKMGLNNQFLMQEATIEMPGWSYQGSGYLTLNDDGTVTGSWIDNSRNIFSGSGTIEGNTMTITWAGSQGKSTRITERIGKDQMEVTAKEETPQGTMESKGVYTRKK